MNADMLNRGTEDLPSLSLSLSFIIFLGVGGGEGANVPSAPPLDPPLLTIVSMNYTIEIQLSVLVYKADIIIISLFKCIMFLP